MRHLDTNDLAYGEVAEAFWAEVLGCFGKVNRYPLGDTGPDLYFTQSGREAYIEVERKRWVGSLLDLEDFGIFERRLKKAAKVDLPSILLTCNKGMKQAALIQIPPYEEGMKLEPMGAICKGLIVPASKVVHISSVHFDVEKLLGVIDGASKPIG